MDNLHDWVQVFVCIGLGLVGGALHYVKKRYVDETLKGSFCHYLAVRRKDTVYATIAIIMTEAKLAEEVLGDPFTATLALTAITMGYTLDSGINRANNKESVSE